MCSMPSPFRTMSLPCNGGYPAPSPVSPLVELLFWPRHLDQDPAHAFVRHVRLDTTGGAIAAA